MFELSRQKSKLTSINPRAELHGEDKKLACDIKFDMKVSNDVLSFEGAFLGQLMLPSGKTVLETVSDNKMLPAPDGGAE